MTTTVLDAPVMDAPQISFTINDFVKHDLVTNGDTIVTIEEIVQSLHHLPRGLWAEVLQFIQFLEYKNALLDDPSEDESLWDAVQAHQAYKVAHPNETPIIFESAEDFLKASENW